MGNEITNFLKKENKVEFNWAKILYLLTYISYGFFGVISKYNNDLFTISFNILDTLKAGM